MRRPRRPTTIGAAYGLASTAAALGQYQALDRVPTLLVGFGLVTLLALRYRADRWTTVLLLLHLLVAATGPTPRTQLDWACWALIATGLTATHLLSGWLPWRHEHVQISWAAARLLGMNVIAAASVALGMAGLAATLIR